MKAAMIGILVWIASCNVMAQVDPTADGIGIYFDRVGGAYSTEISGVFEHFQAYVTITRPSYGEAMSGWQAEVSIVEDHSVAALTRWVQAGIDWDFREDAYHVHIGAYSLPVVDNCIVVLILDGYVYGDQTEVDFLVGPYAANDLCPDAPCYASAGEDPLLIPLTVADWFGDGVVARITFTPTTPTETMSFGALKTLYR